MIKKTFFMLVLLIFAIPSSISLGQETPEGPYYEVQSGDSLWGIAQRFGVSMTELAEINNISDPAQLKIGMNVIIPGLEGLTGKLTTRTVKFGESLKSLSRYYQIPVSLLARLNHLTSPGEVYAGYSLVIIENETSDLPYERMLIDEGQSL
ncbi:MAG: LysM peptidoglycan-binding domain-containing protein, partial [Anaerolineales bacterium]|nr:LysM peptidoglycan-binding domain-containing protein [Anaerolineales bacterium]